MPVKINFTDDGTVVEFIISGALTGQEVIEANEILYTRENLLRLKYKIIDRSTCTDYNVMPNEVQKIAAQDQKAAVINPDIIVILISATSLQFGMARMFQSYTGFRTKIFKDRESADTWLKNKLKKSKNDIELL